MFWESFGLKGCGRKRVADFRYVVADWLFSYLNVL